VRTRSAGHQSVCGRPPMQMKTASACSMRTMPPASVTVEQLLDAVELEPPPVHARRREHDPSGDLGAVFQHELDLLVVAVEAPAANAVQDHQLRAELLRLPPREARQLGAADPVRKPEEVLDQRRVRSLPARRVAFEHDRREAIRGRIHRRRKTSRPGANHDQVVLRAPRPSQPPPRVRKSRSRWCSGSSRRPIIRTAGRTGLTGSPSSSVRVRQRL